MWANRSFNILERRRAEVRQIQRELAGEVLPDAPGNTNAARLRKSLKPYSDVHSIASNTIIDNNDITYMYANPQQKLHRAFDIAFLNCQGAFNCLDRGSELGKKSVPHNGKQASGVQADQRLNYLRAECSNLGERALLVFCHPARITNHICRQNGRQPALDTPSGHNTPSLLPATIAGLVITAKMHPTRIGAGVEQRLCRCGHGL